MKDNITVKTTTGMTTIARENIAAFTVISPNSMEIHLQSGTIFTTEEMAVVRLKRVIIGEISQEEEE